MLIIFSIFIQFLCARDSKRSDLLTTSLGTPGVYGSTSLDLAAKKAKREALEDLAVADTASKISRAEKAAAAASILT